MRNSEQKRTAFAVSKEKAMKQGSLWSISSNSKRGIGFEFDDGTLRAWAINAYAADVPSNSIILSPKANEAQASRDSYDSGNSDVFGPGVGNGAVATALRGHGFAHGKIESA